MGKKFKITEDQLKRLVENKNKIQEEDTNMDDPIETTEEETVDLPEEEEENQINEAVEKIKAQFKRFL